MTHAADTSSTTSPAVPAVLIFGVDGSAKPHASRFGAPDADLARKAAGLMGFRVLDLQGDDALLDLAGKVPAGRIFASGSAFTPFIARPLFERLCAAGGVTPAELADERAKLAAAKPTVPAATSPAPDLPADWDSVKVGSLVLATEGDGEGWYEATVTAPADAGGVFVLQWRDYDHGPFTRHRDQLALLPPLAAEPA